jgi:hypothetical protein
MLVSADYSRINHHSFRVGIFDKCIENHLQKSHCLNLIVRPALETLVDATPFSIFFRQTAPSSAVFAYPNNRFYEFSIVGRPTHPFSPRKALEIRFHWSFHKCL